MTCVGLLEIGEWGAGPQLMGKEASGLEAVS